MTRWHWVAFKEAGDMRINNHAVSDALVYPLIGDLKARGFAKKRALWVRHIFFDQPGGVITTAPKQVINVDGLIYETWCDEVSYTANKLRRAEVRRFKGGLRYYKFHAFYRCLVLTPEQRDTMVRELDKAEDSATRRTQEFFAMRDRLLAAQRAREEAQRAENAS